MSLVAGVDFGGTKIAIALLDEDYNILDRVRTKTPEEGPEAVVESIVEGIHKLSDKPDAVGVGAPGLTNDGVVLMAENLLGWGNPVPLADLLGEVLSVPVAVGNDANVFTVGEFAAGAGRGAKNLLGVSFGTGIGGGLVLDGHPYSGTYGGAGEFGHMCVRANGALCGCGRRGCVEAYAGRASMELVVEVAVAGGRQTALETIRREQGKRRLTSGVWAEALKQGDRLAAEVLDEAISAVGAAVGAVINMLDLDRVVVGGGLAEKLGQDLPDRIGDAARPYLLDHHAERKILLAELGDDSGAVGAAALAREVMAS
ncbi:MAG TPA: ROK family protein [Egibacteraceae bacterium]|nr:ROK family protein [Egibacteraceae bacterium]